MEYKLSLAVEAHYDIEKTTLYISSKNPAAATRVVARIFKALDNIRINPKIGGSAAERFNVETDSLYFVVLPYSYIIFYNIVGQEIRVNRVLDSRRDCISVLG